MSAANRCVVTMHFDDGTQFSDWVSFTMRDCYTDPLGELQVVAAPTRANRAEYRKHLKKGHLVTIKIDGVNQGTFLIMSCPRTIGRNGVVYNITCKTPLATPYEGSVDPDLEISSQTDTPVSTRAATSSWPGVVTGASRQPLERRARSSSWVLVESVLATISTLMPGSTASSCCHSVWAPHRR